LAGLQSDSELVMRTLAGDQQAFGELVARYGHAVFGVAFHRLGDFENARDAAQEAFLKAYTGLPKLRKPESFASWLYHITDLTALEVARRPRREVLLPPDEMPSAGLRAPDAAASDLAQQVREALAALDEPTRLAVVLHYIDGYSHAEVANFLGTTTGAVRARVSRAKSRIKEEIMSEAERALKEAVERTLAALSARDWQAALDEVRRSGLPPEKHPDLAFGAGVALIVPGRRPFNPRRMSEGAELLLRAWEGGRHDPETVWLLRATLADLGEHSRITPILARYMEETQDPNERVKAGAYLAGAWWAVGDYAAAVAAHRACMTGLGEQPDVAAKLDSYLHAAVAYAQHGVGLEWLEKTLELWNSAPEDVKTLESAISLLDAVQVVALDEGEQVDRRREMAVQYGEDLLRDPRLEDREDRLTALSAKGRINVGMFRIYSLMGLHEKAKAALDTAKAVANEVVRGAEALGADRDAWRDAAFVILANAGQLCRFAGRTHEALALLKQAEQVGTYPCGPIFFGLVALILQTGGDNQESLHYLRRVAEDKRWAYSGFPQKEFFQDPAFESVRNDREFLAVINGLREAASQEQN